MSSAPIDDRFELLSLAGEGGMGRVYRARDRRDGAVVALKLLRDEVHSDETITRFRREIGALAQLDDPAIVRYVAHGTTRDGTAYLAMQWIDGEELRLRLRRGTLDVAGTLTVATRIAGALAHAHARNVIHRDVKPANIVLPDEVLGKAMLIDFGLARTAEHELTRAGVLLGTPTYMAPEQARGHAIGPAVDTFALACVMFHCLTGHSPFAAKGATAVLARVLFEEPPPLPPHVPTALAQLVASMLRKNAAERPSMQAVYGELSLLRASTSRPEGAPLPVAALGVAEQRIVGVVVMGAPAMNDEDETLRWVPGARAVDASRVQAVASRFGAQSMLLPNGSLLAVLTTTNAAKDLALRATELALALQQQLSMPVGLATGRAEVRSGIPVGDAVDRAVALAPSRLDGVHVDIVTAELLDDRFAQEAHAGGTVVRRRAELGSARTLLGKPTPCVGRDAELAMLDGILAHCLDESAARAVLVTAPAGFGKSRLRQEYLERVRLRSEVQIWTARADSIGGAPFGMIAQMVRQTSGIAEGEETSESRAKLVARARDPRVATFLGEIIGVEVGGPDDVQLRAARRDAMLMAEQMRRAFTDFVDAETSAAPLVIVLEDVHWADPPTVAVLDHALRLLAERPFLVVAFARPEVHDTFPGLFADRGLQPIPLAALPRRAAERLVHAALPSAAKEVSERLIEQAAGNVFYLEELIRATAEGREAPPTLVAMVQGRLALLEPTARRALRAASVFGETFWDGGVSALLGSEGVEATRRSLEFLVASELCARRETSKLAGQTEYVFRHAFVRDGAYGMLTETDARLGHRLAAKWLEAAGETAVAVIAEHHARGGESARAVDRFLRAAEHSLESNDLAGAIAVAERGVASGASGEALGALRNVQAQAHLWRGETAEMERAAGAAVSLLPPHSAKWAEALAALAVAKQRGGRGDDVEELALRLIAREDVDERARSSVARAAARISTLLFFGGRQDLGDRVLAFAERAAVQGGREVQARIHHAHAPRARQLGRQAEALERLAKAEAAFREVGDEPNACLMLSNRGFSLSELGAYKEALPVLEQALALAERHGLPTVAATARSNLGMVHLRLGNLGEAERIERAALAGFELRDQRQEGVALMYLAAILLEAGKAEVAEGEARAALGLLEAAPPLRPFAAAVLASALLARGRAAEALEAMRDAMAWQDAGGRIEEGEALVRLTHARALLATGENAEAHRRIQEARDRLLERARAISNARWKKTFLRAIPEHVLTFELAAECDARSPADSTS